MLNNTSSYSKPLREIDFKVMGLDYTSSEFLNWCMKNRDNLEYIKLCNTLEKISTTVVLHFDHIKVIKRIDDAITHTRA